MDFVDLHLHTRHSDGSDTPRDVVARAVAARASAIAITDHDTVAGVHEAGEAAGDAGLDFLTGVEVSTYFGGRELHVIALGIDCDNPGLLAGLARLCNARARRSQEILDRLAELDMPVPVAGDADGGEAAGRMHIARALTSAGYVKKPQEAFDRYLNPGKPAFVPKWSMPVDEAIDLIHGAGGLAFVAHPGLGNHTRKLLPKLLELPFDGIEAYHISHSAGRVEEFTALARERNLLICGGSDCHGTIKDKALLGQVHTPRHAYDAIIQRLAACDNTTHTGFKSQ